ncbi:MAG: SCO family protein [Thermaerobacter sp.]|nr:hypothetical protein [Bacillota bacterium]REJ34175.1 MAG: hypothetical protein DIU84_08060 [Bacillota bacterium]
MTIYRSRSRLPLIVTIVVVVGILVAAAVLWQYMAEARTPRGVVLQPREAPDFELIDHRGEPYRLSDDDRVRVIFFGYTYCPDVCPTTLVTYRQVHQLLGDRAGDVRFLFVTVDPERDDVARMAEYVTRFHPDFVGLTGDRAALEKVWAEYGVYVNALPPDPDRGGAYEVEHSALSFVIDGGGMMRIVHNYGTPAEDMAHDIRLLLSQRR